MSALQLHCGCLFCRFLLYFRQGAAVPSGWRLFPTSSHRGEVMLMVTYAELFQLLLVLIAFAGLVFQISKRK